jgi:hypothetical protein
MSLRSVCHLSLIAFLLFSVIALPAMAVQPASRIATIDNSVRVALPGTAHPLATPAADRGAVEDSLQLSGLALQFQRSAAQEAALETLVQQQNDPLSPKFHQWLTPEAFAAQFGMSAADIAKAKAWLESQGFTVLKVADSGNAILFSGTAGQVRAAMGTSIHHYQVNGALHYANEGTVALPATLAAVVGHVSGLDDFKPRSKAIRAQSAASNPADLKAMFTSGISGSHLITPGDFSTIYDTTPLYNGGYTGAGIAIGIAGQTDIVLSDIAAFRAAAGLAAKAPTVVLTTGSSDPGISYGDLGEADIDLEWSGGVAPGANIVFLNSTNAFYSLVWGIQNRVTINSVSTLIPILSASYGLCEAEQSTSTVTTMEAAFVQAASQGQTVIAAAGDTGAADCDNSTTTTTVTVSTLGLAVDYPASSANVTAIGGTEFNEGTTLCSTTYWNGNGSCTYTNNSGDIISSAKSYIPEMAWNDTPTLALSNYYSGLLGGGGGASILFAKPSWQTGVTGIPADGKRDVPDISLNASPVHDAYLVCTQVVLSGNPNQYSGSCGNGFRIADGTYADTNNLTAYGGTSVGAPSFAGVVALIEQKMGLTLGGVNKALYGIASNSTSYASAFHDITAGNNEMPCSTGTGCSSGLVGYTTTVGYDQATGLGSIDAANLATAYASYFAANGGTTLAITYTPTTPVIGSPVTFTATISYTSSTAPAGTVTFTIDGTAGSPVTVATAAASTGYSFATGGTHTISAVYTSSNNFLSSNASTTISGFTNAAGTVATATTLTGTPTTVSLYGAAPAFTATVASVAGGIGNSTVTFTVGAVSIKVSTSCSLTATSCVYTYTPTSVTSLNGFSAGTTSVSAHYDGSTTYQQSLSSTLPVTVLNPAFTITAPPMTVSSSVTAAASTSTITITSTGGFNDLVGLKLSTSNYTGCGYITPSSVTPPANGSITAVITLGNCTNAMLIPYGPRAHRDVVAAGMGRNWFAGGVAGLGILLAFASFSRKRRLPRMAAVLAVVLLGGMLASAVGCSSSGGVTGSGLVPGTYQVTVIGTDTTNSSIAPVSTTFTVTVN